MTKERVDRGAAAAEGGAGVGKKGLDLVGTQRARVNLEVVQGSLKVLAGVEVVWIGLRSINGSAHGHRSWVAQRIHGDEARVVQHAVDVDALFTGGFHAGNDDVVISAGISVSVIDVHGGIHGVVVIAAGVETDLAAIE